MSALRPYQFQSAGALSFGQGACGALGKERALKKAQRVLVVTDAGVKAAGLCTPALDSLGDRVALLDDATVPDADLRHINTLAARAKDAQVDAIVAIGGGSVMDTAKAVNIVLSKGGQIADYEGFGTVRARLLPLVCVPTTAGTGSEATQFVVVADQEAGRKLIISDLSVVPTLGVLDPELVRSLPKGATAATGVDALTHAVEAMASRMANPVGQALALQAISLIVADKALERSLRDPEDLSARGDMLTAAALAGQAISSCMLGACHAFAHALGAHKKVPHGVANGVFLVPIMRFNAERALSAYASIGRLLGGAGDRPALAEHAITEISTVVHEVAEIPTQLSQLGVTSEDIDPLADGVMADPDLQTNPVSLKGKERAVQILTDRL